MMSTHHLFYESPLGTLRLVANEKALTHIFWPEHKGAVIPNTTEEREHPILTQTQTQLQAYFAGTLKRFEVPLQMEGTLFQREVWAALQTIPLGEVWSYGTLAKSIDRPKAVRAVGAANGRNPISIIVPCHRVIGANGTLTGFAGGMESKRWLLVHERKLCPQKTPTLPLFN